MSIRIVTDSTCDLPKSLISEHEVTVVPLTVNFKEESYADGIEITSEAFFKRLKNAETLPFTSQVNPAQFEAVFKEILDKGDEIVGMFISSTFSGTYNSAVIAKETFSKEEQERIHLFDSRTSTLALGLIVIEAAKAAKEGKSLSEVIDTVTYGIANSKILFMLDTLVYLSKGGRISPTQAMVGNLLNVKAILTINDNAEIVKLDKVRGRKKGMRWISDELVKRGVTPNNIPFALMHGDDLGNLELLKEQLEDNYKDGTGLEACIGAVIGTHLGPGCVGVAYIEKNK